MNANLSALLYLAAAVCFILALRGLSHPLLARRGNLFGMAGMVLAIGTTLAQPGVLSFPIIAIGVVIGGAIGTAIALKIKMTAMPQLVAAFHSLVGLAAVLVAGAALHNPEAFHIGVPGAIKVASRIEMSAGAIIGALTFTGSLVAFAKLQGLVSGAPLVFFGQHGLNLAFALGIIGLAGYFCTGPAPELFWLMTALAFALGVLIIVPIGGADMPVVISMLNSYSGWAAAGIGFTLENNLLIVTGALPDLTVRSFACATCAPSAPKPPRITLMNERFMARHMM